jgi:hypothetical protein
VPNDYRAVRMDYRGTYVQILKDVTANPKPKRWRQTLATKTPYPLIITGK